MGQNSLWRCPWKRGAYLMTTGPANPETKTRFLSKSRFKVGHECPSKLFYYENSKYANANDTDAFLRALADGGFQVGELAKIYYEGGIEVTEREHFRACEITRDLLQRDNVVIFEAALMHEDLFVRVDILVKKGQSIRLIEVKSASWS